MVTSKPVRDARVGPTSRRTATFQYTVVMNNERKVVCKKAFLAIHGVSERRVSYVVKTGDTGVAPVDKRGKHTPHNKTPDANMKLVHDHIRSLPTCTSHYSRAKSHHRVYLPPGYSHARCYQKYKAWCAEKGVPDSRLVTLECYSRTFTSFNIGTNPPRIDTCSICDRIKNELAVAAVDKDQRKISKLETERKLHRLRAEVARNLMKAYEQDHDSSLFAIAMDLQQTLVTPSLSTNVAYYKRKMWTYNFGVHNLKHQSQAHLYVWNEATAKRGSSEIGSCLLHYVNNVVPDDCTQLVIFSDNCGGQNKNLNLSLLMLRFIQSGRFTSIKHYFLMSGHSYMACDRDFGNLEQYFRGREIYTTDHYVELMKEARLEDPFTIIEMSSEQFVDLQPLQSLVTKTQVTKSRFKDGKMFLYAEDFKQGMAIWHNYNEDIGAPLQVKLQKGKGAPYDRAKFDLTSVALPEKYPMGVKMKADKLADLNSLLTFIPLEHKQFFTDLFLQQGRLDAEGPEENPDDPEAREDDFLDY